VSEALCDTCSCRRWGGRARAVGRGKSVCVENCGSILRRPGVQVMIVIIRLIETLADVECLMSRYTRTKQ
jgi:hypothetical protein